MRRRIPDARLRLVGRPPAGPLPAGVEAAGEVASVAPELRQASLFVLPSFQEGFGIVVAEALASGVPAVVTPCGGPEELVRESGGGTVLPDFEPGTLADAIVTALGDRAAAGRAACARPLVRRDPPLAGPLPRQSSRRRSRSSTMPDVAVVIGNYQGERLLPDCLASLETQTLRPSEVIVVDGASTDRSVEVAEALGARVLRRENRGLGYLYNEGARAATAELVLLLNNDVALDERCLELLAAALEADGVALRRRPAPGRLGRRARDVKARTTLARGRLLREYIPSLHLDDSVPSTETVPTVSANGAAMLVRRELLLELGGFDETFFMEWEDLDLCWRAWLRGHGSVYVPDAWLRHRVGGATAARERTRPALVVAPQPDALRAQVPSGGPGRPRGRRRAAAAPAPPAPDRAGAARQSRASCPRSCACAAGSRRRRRTSTGCSRGCRDEAARARRLERPRRNLDGRARASATTASRVELARDFDVTLVVPFETDLVDERVRDRARQPLGSGPHVRARPRLRRSSSRSASPCRRCDALARAADASDLRPLRAADAGAARARRARDADVRTASVTARLNNLTQEVALATGDAFICASEKQRDFWLGALMSAGRLDHALLRARSRRCAP